MKNISENFPAFIDSEYLRFLKQNEINFNLIKIEQFESYSRLFEKAEYEISKELGLMPDFHTDKIKTNLMIYGDDFSVTDIQINDKNENFIKLDTHYEMTIDISLDNNDDDGSTLITSLSLIINCISNVDNTKVKIEHIEKGSLYARIRVYIKDLIAKEEVKAVLETSKEVVVKTISAGQVSHSETKKNLADIQKIKAEKELIEKEIEAKPSEFESKISNALDLERKALENEKLKIELTKEKLEVLNKLSELATKGILDVDDIRIDINEILYLIKKGDSIEAPESDIDKIT